MESLLEANPENVNFLTPNSKSQVSPSILSETKRQSDLNLANSMDKYNQISKRINRGSPKRVLLRHQNSVKINMQANPVVGIHVNTLASGNNSSDEQEELE